MESNFELENHINSLENTNTNNEDKEYSSFCQFLLSSVGSLEVSFRLIAEKESLKEKLVRLNKEHLRVIKVVDGLPLPGETTLSSLRERFNYLKKYNEVGYGVFWCPNKYGPGYEEGYKNLVKIRSLVVDLDDGDVNGLGVLGENLSPSVVVESSKGKYQAIWKLFEALETNRNDVSIDFVNEVLSELAALMDGDLNAARVTQVFRMAGFWHWKKRVDGTEGYKSRVVSVSPLPVSFDDIVSSLKKKRKEVRKKLKESYGGNGSGKSGGSVGVDLDKLLSCDSSEVITVGPGERHKVVLALQIKLLAEGKSEEEVGLEVERVVRRSFVGEGKEDFLAGGSRSDEVKRSLSCASTYVEEEKKEKEKELKKIFDASSIKALPSDVVISPSCVGTNGTSRSGFVYDFSRGTLSLNKYTESAVVDRVLQRFALDMCRIEGGRFYCFNNKQVLWKVQNERSRVEVDARVVACIKDMICEKDFIAKFINAKQSNKDGSLSERSFKLNEKAKEAAESSFLKASSIRSMGSCVLGNIDIVQKSASDFDSVPYLLYCKNGVVDMRVGELRAARNTDYLLRKCDVEFKGDGEAGSKCPGWLNFLEEVFKNNLSPSKMVEFMGVIFGYSLSGEISLQKIFCHLGCGANGKSKVLSALSLISGQYGTQIDPDELKLSSNGFGGARFERTGAKVEGCRVAVIDDLDVGGTWNEGFVKTLTGKSIRCRAEYETSRVSPNRVKFHLGLNDAPRAESENLGLLRRLCIIPYARTFTVSSTAENRIDAMIEEEKSGILLWAIKGYQRLVAIQRGEFGGEAALYPPETLMASEEYRQENFPVEGVLMEVFSMPSGEEELSWCDKNGISYEEFLGSGGAIFDEDSGIGWRSLQEIEEAVNSRLHANGRYGLALNARKIGIQLSRVLGFKQKKAWSKVSKNAVSYYFVKQNV